MIDCELYVSQSWITKPSEPYMNQNFFVQFLAQNIPIYFFTFSYGTLCLVIYAKIGAQVDRELSKNTHTYVSLL
jgi:hypothetical protein